MKSFPYLFPSRCLSPSLPFYHLFKPVLYKLSFRKEGKKFAPFCSSEQLFSPQVFPPTASLVSNLHGNCGVILFYLTGHYYNFVILVVVLRQHVWLPSLFFYQPSSLLSFMVDRVLAGIFFNTKCIYLETIIGRFWRLQ